MKNLIIFIGGLCVGAGATYALIREKMEIEKKMEIDELKEYYRNKSNSVDDEVESSDMGSSTELNDDTIRNNEMNKPTMEEYSELIKKTKYSTSSTPENDARIREMLKMRKEDIDTSVPYVIPLARYEEDMKCPIKETLHYYEEDGVLADEADQVLDITKTIGDEALEHFGDEIDGIVYVRNEAAETDYEVVLSHSSYERYMQMTDDSYDEEDDDE